MVWSVVEHATRIDGLTVCNLTWPQKEPSRHELASLALSFTLCLNFDLISVSTPNSADLLLIITHNGNQSKMRGWTDWHAERGCAASSHPAHRISITPGRRPTTECIIQHAQPQAKDMFREGAWLVIIQAKWEGIGLHIWTFIHGINQDLVPLIISRMAVDLSDTTLFWKWFLSWTYSSSKKKNQQSFSDYLPNLIISNKTTT